MQVICNVKSHADDSQQFHLTYIKKFISLYCINCKAHVALAWNYEEGYIESFDNWCLAKFRIRKYNII